MGGGNGPPWFTPDFPGTAARREPFPDVRTWQSTFVRYAYSDEAQPDGWDAESCRRNLRNLGRHDHYMLGQTSLPDSINMRIVEAPAEFALPVKQDRRLLPCFKVRMEIKHRSAVSMPITVRAHVLTQQDKEHIEAWTPAEDGSTDGQKAVTELKGTSVIRCMIEAGGGSRLVGSSGELKKLAAGREAQGAVPSGLCGSQAANNLMATNCTDTARSVGPDRSIKVEPSFSFGTSTNGHGHGHCHGGGAFLAAGAGGMAGPAANGAAPAQREFGMGMGMGVGAGVPVPLDEHAQQLLDSYNLVDSPGGLSANGPVRNFGAGAGGLFRDLSGPSVAPVRDINLTTLFAPNRPDPVVTLATSGRMSGTGSSLPSFSSGLGGGGGGLRAPGTGFDAAVEMLMQPSQQQQQQQQQRRQLPLHGGGLMDAGAGAGNVAGAGQMVPVEMQQRGPMLPGVPPRPPQMSPLPSAPAPAQQYQQQRMESGQGPLQQAEQGLGTPQTGCSSGNSAGGDQVPLVTTTQDFEFINLEFLKPTRMNKVYMAFTASIMDTDLLFVVFNVPTIGICRAEQREKACKKLNIDYKLLSHFDQGAERPGAIHVGSHMLSLPRGLSGADSATTGASSGGRHLAPLEEPDKHAQELQVLHSRSGQAQAQAGAPDMKMGQMQGGGGPSPMMGGGGRMGQFPEPKVPLPQQPSDVDFPRLGPGMSVADMGMPGGGMLGGGGGGVMGPGGGMCGGGGGMLPNGGSMGVPQGMPPGGMPGAGMLGGGGPVQGGVPNGLAGGMGVGLNSLDFYFGNGGGMGPPNGGGMGPNASGGMGPHGSSMGPTGGNGMAGMAGGASGMEFGMGSMMGNSRKRDQGPKEDDNYRFQPVAAAVVEMPPYQGFMGLTSSDVEMLMPAPHSRMAMRDFINEVYESTGLNRKLTHMDMQALLSQAGFPMDSNREHDTISPQQWDEFCAQFRSIVATLQQVASVWNMDDPVVISGFDMDRVGTITALANEPAGTFVCRFSMSQPGCLVLTCKVGPVHPRADAMGLIHAIIKIDDLHERRVDTWIRDYAGATHLLDVYRQKRVDKRKVFATNYTRLRGLEMGEQLPGGLGQGFM